MHAQEMLRRMALRQDNLNRLANGENWTDLRRPWFRAIWTEAAELLQHYGTWEWWKQTHPDLPQVKLEMVDIFHFGLSDVIERRGIEDVPLVMFPAVQAIAHAPEPDHETFIGSVESVATTALRIGSFNIDSFFEAWGRLGAGFIELYHLYMAKSVLNEFRQKHGYKEGTYKKTWGGKEDNWYLVKIVEGMPYLREDAAFATYVYERLKAMYYSAVYEATSGCIQQSANY